MFVQERVDGRSRNDLRPPCVTFGDLGRADGSCRFQLGDSVAVCSVNGPYEAKAQFSSHLGMYFDVVVRPNTGITSPRERLIEQQVTSLLNTCVDTSRYPYTQMTVAVEISSDDGSIAAVVCNSAVLAVMNSGIAMRYIPLCTCVALNSRGETILDPDATEEAKATSVVCQAVNLMSGEVVQTSSSGDSEPFGSMSICQAAALALEPFIRESLEKHLGPLLNPSRYSSLDLSNCLL